MAHQIQIQIRAPLETKIQYYSKKTSHHDNNTSVRLLSYSSAPRPHTFTRELDWSGDVPPPLRLQPGGWQSAEREACSMQHATTTHTTHNPPPQQSSNEAGYP